MAGKAMELTERDVAIVAAVADFGLMNREQILRLHGFGSVTRVNATLLRLVKAGYLSRRFQPTLTGWRRALYYLGPAGAALLQSRADTPLADRRQFTQWSDLFVEHQVLVAEARLAFALSDHPGYSFDRWLTEAALRQMRLEVVPDGFVQYAVGNRTFAAFLELDRGTEPLRTWRQKTEGYLHLAFSGQYETLFRRRFFRVLVLAPTARRLDHLRQEVGRQTQEIFWFATLPEFCAQGPLACRWRRVTGAGFHSLDGG